MANSWESISQWIRLSAVSQIDFYMKRRLMISLIILTLTLAGDLAVPASVNLNPYKISAWSDAYYRTELYFGRSIPGGGQVSDNEWEKFLADVVTPRFPDGFTILNA